MDVSLVDTLWVLVCASLVFFMQAGFLCLETGLTRSKNSINVAIKNLTDLGISVVLFWAFGYAIMFGPTAAGLFGQADFALDFSQTGVWLAAFFLFQAMFCGTAVTILSGAVAERIQFGSYMLLAAIVSTLIYPVFGHWAWNGVETGVMTGWLGVRGFVDFAGSTVVHSVGGWTSLAAVLVLGARTGRFPAHGEPRKISGSNIPVATLGVMILWFGWFGFNGGSALAANGNAGMAMLVTHISASAGALTWMFAEWVRFGKPSALGIVTGMVAGLGTITPASGYVGPAGALIIGLTAGFVCFIATIWIKRVLKIDDSLDVFPVHGVGGILGTLFAGFFASDQLGIFSGQGFAEGMSMSKQLGVQAIGVISTLFYTAVVTVVILKLMALVMPLRVSGEEEREGLDLVLHNERGYDL